MIEALNTVVTMVVAVRRIGVIIQYCKTNSFTNAYTNHSIREVSSIAISVKSPRDMDRSWTENLKHSGWSL